MGLRAAHGVSWASEQPGFEHLSGDTQGSPGNSGEDVKLFPKAGSGRLAISPTVATTQLCHGRAPAAGGGVATSAPGGVPAQLHYSPAPGGSEPGATCVCLPSSARAVCLTPLRKPRSDVKLVKVRQERNGMDYISRKKH